MRKREEGITLMVLVIMIIVLLILAGITLGSISNHNGVIEQSKETAQSAQRESIIEKIEADLYTEKVKTGNIPSKNDLKDLIKEKDYGTINDNDSFTSKAGNHKIEFNKIQGWKSAYKELAYLESTGTQYIDTEVIPTDNTGVKSIFSQNIYDANSVSGCVTNNWTNRFYLWYIYGANTVSYGYSGYYPKNKSDLELNKKYEGTVNYKNDKKAIFDGVVYEQNLGTYTSSGLSICLFATKQAENKIIQYHSSLKLYEVEITEDKTIIKDFIPVLDENNVVCLYDKIDRKYYYNQGTGEFLYDE